jgi:hypothetical protein
MPRVAVRPSVVLLFGLAALVLVPWTALLVSRLPSAHRATHWNIAWGGFDAALALVLLAVAATAWRHSPWLEGAATAAATLLFVDAWFDMLTASTRTDLVIAIAEAAFVEVPLAVFSLLLARRAKRRWRRQSQDSRDAPDPPLHLVTGQPARVCAIKSTSNTSNYGHRRLR